MSLNIMKSIFSAFVFTGLTLITTVRAGAGPFISLIEVNETYLEFNYYLTNTDWQGELYLVGGSCKDRNGSVHSDAECQLTTATSYTPQPVLLTLSGLEAGSTYGISGALGYRNGSDNSSARTTAQFTFYYCTVPWKASNMTVIEGSVDPYTVNYTVTNTTNPNPGSFDGYAVSYFKFDVTQNQFVYIYQDNNMHPPKGTGYTETGSSRALDKGYLYEIAAFTSAVCDTYRYSRGVPDFYLSGVDAPTVDLVLLRKDDTELCFAWEHNTTDAWNTLKIELEQSGTNKGSLKLDHDSDSTAGVACVTQNGANTAENVDVLYSVGNEITISIFGNPELFTRFSTARTISLNFTDYKAVEVSIDCSAENGTCLFTALVDYTLSSHLSFLQVVVNYTSNSGSPASATINSTNCSPEPQSQICSINITDVALTSGQEFSGSVLLYDDILFNFSFIENTLLLFTQHVPTGGTTAQPVLVHGTTAQPGPLGGTTTQLSPSSGATAQLIPPGGTTGQAVPLGGTTSQAVPLVGTTGQAVRSGGTNGQAVPLDGTTVQAVPLGGATGQAVPLGGTTDQAVPLGGTTGQAVRPGGTTGQTVPPGGTTGEAVPLDGTTGQAVPLGGTTAQQIPLADTTAQQMPPGGTTVPPIPPGETTAQPAPLAGTTNHPAATDGTNAEAANPTTKNLNITISLITSNSANLSAVDADGTATIEDIVAFCESLEELGCNGMDYETNTDATENAWLNMFDLMPGTPYEITVNKSTFGGVPDTLHFSTITFCTEPNPGVLLSKVNSTSVRIAIAVIDGNFDDCNLTFTPSDVSDLTFTRNEFPVEVAGLTDNQSYNLTFVFGVGSSGNCGIGGPRHSDPINLQYQPASYAALNVDVIETTQTSVNITVEDSEGSANISNLTVSCSSEQHLNCSSSVLTVNPIASDPGWVSYSGLEPGSSYQVTIMTASVNSNPDALIGRTLVFCTEPNIQLEDFQVTIISSNSVKIALRSDANHFDNGTVTAQNSDDDLVAEEYFSRTQFPVSLNNLPSDQFFKLTLTFSVGTDTDCGDGGIKTTQPVVYEYVPGEGNNSDGIHEFLSMKTLSGLIFVHIVGSIIINQTGSQN